MSVVLSVVVRQALGQTRVGKKDRNGAILGIQTRDEHGQLTLDGGTLGITRC